MTIRRPFRNLTAAIAIALVVAIGLVVITARKIFLYAADPIGEKRCDPMDASHAAPMQRFDASADRNVPWEQRGGTINDSSCLNRTSVYGVVRVTRAEDVRETLAFARAHRLKVAIAGVRHSQGGQAFAKGAIVLDMTGFNALSLDADRKVLHVQSGARWHDIQAFLHPRFAVKAMQSTDLFTVGGSISVNAHGMDHRAGSIAASIRSMRVMLPNGEVVQVGPTERPELFRLVVGGYGLFGVVLDADLDVTDNSVYQSERQILSYDQFPAVFERIAADDRYALLYAHLSTAPRSLLRQMILYTYRKADVAVASVPPLTDVPSVKLRRAVFNLSKRGGAAMELKWWAEKYIEPRLETCLISRNEALASGERCLVSRNEPMHDPVFYLKNRLPDETDILQEYFIPRPRLLDFVDRLRTIVQRTDANLLNASIRVVHREDNLLTYAPDAAFAVVLYLNQTTDADGNRRMRELTRQLIDATTDVGGRFFLPYQLHYTPEQLERSYPEIHEFFDAKRQYDPDGLLTNTMYETYAPSFLQRAASTIADSVASAARRQS